MIRLVAFDLDGTVLSETNKPSRASLDAIREIVGRGIAAASISGRNVEKSQQPFMGEPGLAVALYVGSYNGAVVLGSGANGPRRLLHEERLPADVFGEVAAYIGERGLNFVYCRCETGEEIREQYVTDRDSPSTRALAALVDLDLGFDARLLDRILEGDVGPPPKLILMPGDALRDPVLEEMRERFGNRLYLARTGTDRVEVMHPGVNKAVALGAIARARGVPMEETLAVGDGDNDLPMLKAAGVGVLVGSADAQTRGSVAGSRVEIAPGFEEEGFAETIRRYVLGGAG